jgi:hypothetical protein
MVTADEDQIGGTRPMGRGVDPGDAKFHVDRMALDAICSVVPPEMVTTLVMKDIETEAWESIKTM